MLRQEIYELDVDALEAAGEHVPVRLFSAADHNCHIRRLQPQGANRHAVFLVTESEALTYHYELDLRPSPARTLAEAGSADRAHAEPVVRRARQRRCSPSRSAIRGPRGIDDAALDAATARR